MDEHSQPLETELEVPQSIHPRQLLAVLYRPKDPALSVSPQDVELALCRWPNPNLS